MSQRPDNVSFSHLWSNPIGFLSFQKSAAGRSEALLDLRQISLHLEVNIIAASAPNTMFSVKLKHRKFKNLSAFKDNFKKICVTDLQMLM